MGWIVHAQLVDLLADGLEELSRAGLEAFVAGYARCRTSGQAGRLIRRLQENGWIEQRGRASHAKFRVRPTAKRGVDRRRPQACWDRPWDGHWRVVSFDVPEARRKDRQRLWWALRARRFGLLQRSVWVWPHEMKPILEEIIDAEGIPECFCGFEARRLFLCTNAEVVEAAWGFREIKRRQQAYLEHSSASIAAARAAVNLARLGALAREESSAYECAFSLDPLLPRLLHPAGYRGELVQGRHEAFRRQCEQRLRALAGS